MKVISNEDYDHFQRLRKVFGHLFPEMSGYPFLTGISESIGDDGFPDYVHVCITYGVNDTVTYKREYPQ